MAQWFRRRSLKCEKFTDDGRQVMAIVHLDLWSSWTKKDKPRNCMLLCVKSLKACIRRVIENNLSKRMYYYTRKRGNHFYKCFIQFYIILIHKFVVLRSFKIWLCSDLSDYWPFGPLTLQTNELTRCYSPFILFW